MKEILSSVRKNAVGLGLFAIVTAGVVGVAQVTTKERIAHNIQIAEAKALHEIVPATDYDNDLLSDTFLLSSEEAYKKWKVRLLGPVGDGAVAYVARKDGKAHTVIFPVTAPDGYTTHIDMIVGVRLDGSLAGVRVIDHKETPGLGDKIETKKGDWILQFAGLNLEQPDASNNQWAVKKDGGEFDQFTGATITPRAVVRSVKLALEFFQAHGQDFLADKDYTSKHERLEQQLNNSGDIANGH